MFRRFQVFIATLGILVLWAHSIRRVDGICHICQRSNSVACHSEILFTMCQNDLINATEEFLSCPLNFVCTDKQNICLPKAQAVASCPPSGQRLASSSMTTTASFAIAQDLDAGEFCREKRKAGKFKGDDANEGCKQFIYCYKLSNGDEFHGIRIDCANGRYFDAFSGICTPVKPANCD